MLVIQSLSCSKRSLAVFLHFLIESFQSVEGSQYNTLPLNEAQKEAVKDFSDA